MHTERRQRLQVILISLGMGLVILALKFWAYRVTGSVALKSDALESIVNVLAAIFALGAVFYADRPADEDHPYGHGKIEHFSAVFEGGLISVAAVLILFEAVQAFIEKPELRSLDLGLALNLGAGTLNGALGLFLVRRGKRLRSKALEADGFHVLSDFGTTVGIGLGMLIGQWTGWTWMDPVLAVVVALLLARAGWGLVRESSQALLDMEDLPLVKKLVETVNVFRPLDLVAVHELRTLRSGRMVHVDVHMVVPEFYEVRRAHDLVENFGLLILKKLDLEGEFHTHIDPCMQAYCARCPVEQCSVRKEAQTQSIEIRFSDARAKELTENTP